MTAGMMTIERPKTRLWVCVLCGRLWEMAFHALPARDEFGKVICSRCAEDE